MVEKYVSLNARRTSQVALVVNNLPANVGDVRDVGSISGLGRSPGGGHSNPLLYSCLENPTDRGNCWATGSIGWQRVRHHCRDLARMHSNAGIILTCSETLKLWRQVLTATGGGSLLPSLFFLEQIFPWRNLQKYSICSHSLSVLWTHRVDSYLMHMLNTQHIPWTRSLKLWKGKLWIWACKVDTDQLFPKPSPLSWTCFSGPLIIRQAHDGALVDGIELVELPATFRPGTCLPYSRFHIFQSIANDQGHLGKSYVK